MDPTQTALTTVSMLAPYLAKGGEELAKKLADTTWEHLTELYALVMSKFSRDPKAQKVLESLASKPDHPEIQQDVAAIILQKLKEDPTFARTLRKLLVSSGAKSRGGISQTVSVSGKSANITQIGSVRGNLKIEE